MILFRAALCKVIAQCYFNIKERYVKHQVLKVKVLSENFTSVKVNVLPENFTNKT